MAYKLFIDLNVFLDVFLERTPNWKDSEVILRQAATEQIDLFTSANNLVNVIYVLRKQALKNAEIIEVIDLILTYTQLVNTSNTSFRQALRAGFNDVEDAVQYYTALDVKGINYFVTSNTKDYKKAVGHLPVVMPNQFLKSYKH